MINDRHNIVAEVVRRFKNNKGNNSKLGNMYSWSIPPRITCPGKTKLCSRECYVDDYTCRYPNTLIAYERNLVISKRRDFDKILIEALGKLPAGLLRLHVSGDFYSVRYTRTWFEALEANQHIKPFCFTRSWRVPKLLAVFEKFGPPPWLFASSDPETGEVPAGFREAKMITTPLYQIRKGELPRSKLICDEQMDKSRQCAACGRCPTFRVKGDEFVQLPAGVIKTGVVFAQH